jgi:hypothetical protein
MQTNRYVCDHRGFAADALEAAKTAATALCREHLDESRLVRKPGETVRSLLIAYAVHTLLPPPRPGATPIRGETTIPPARGRAPTAAERTPAAHRDAGLFSSGGDGGVLAP